MRAGGAQGSERAVGATTEVSIGERLRFYRKSKGQKQVVVAGLAGITEDYLSQIERGLKTPTIGLLQKLARILHVPVSTLIGEPEFEHDSVVHPVASAIQRALTSYGDSEDGSGDVDLEDLRHRVDNVWSIWHTSPNRFSEASAILPQLVVDVQHAYRNFAAPGEASQRREAAQLAADLYFLLRTFTKRIGRIDLSLLVADRAVFAAEESEDPLRVGAAYWNLGHILTAQNELEAAEEVTVHAAERLEPLLSNHGPDWAGMYGALWLVASMAAVRNGDSWTARERVRRYAQPAARQAGECNVMWTVFGPTNVNLHAVSLEMEAGEAAEALRLADEVDVAQIAVRERQMTFFLEVARCYDQRREDPAVLVHLIDAERTAPEDMRYNLLARDLVRGLVRRARPTYAPQVRALARRIGLVG